MMQSTAIKAFDLETEPAAVRDAYGKNRFGQACLLARRLVEVGVPFIEVALSDAEGNGGIGWDTHQDNFNGVRSLCEVLDPAWATLISDLNERGLLGFRRHRPGSCRVRRGAARSGRRDRSVLAARGRPLLGWGPAAGERWQGCRCRAAGTDRSP
jgi:hypothetical protein